MTQHPIIHATIKERSMSAHLQSMPAQPMMAGPRIHSLAHPPAFEPAQRQALPFERRSNDQIVERSYRDYRMTMVVALAAALGSGFAASHAWLDPGDTPPVQAAQANSLAPTRSASPVSQQDQQAAFLVRSTLMALNDANRSGNYSVLRDLAGPRFQERNSVLRLREVFHAFREAGVDLSPAGMLAANLTRSETRASDGILALDGSLPLGEAEASRSLRFAMEFEPIAGHWRLLTLAVGIDAQR
jgi:hypothetical protein